MAGFMGIQWHRNKSSSSAADSGAVGGGKTKASAAATAATAATSVSARCCSCLRQFMGKLKKRCLKPCMGRRRGKHCNCSYDPLSYSRNFDADGRGDDDSVRFSFTCSESAALYLRKLNS